MRSLALIVASAVSAALCSCEAGSQTIEAGEANPTLTIGVSTHFGQGWPERYWATLESLPARTARDGVAWRLIEPQPGAYSFTDANSGHVQRICSTGRKAVLVLLPRHPSYDAGDTVFSPAARTAFANYVLALADRFPDCLSAVQIGNEINGRDNMTGQAAKDRPRSYTAILQAVYSTVKPRHPSLQILGGSTNAIGTGFLEDLFDAGALDFMDAVVVHPYRKDAANVDWEIERLIAAMAARGKIKPIWANEFGEDDPDPARAANHLAKMVTLMSSAGVEHAVWYALVDQATFPNFGLFDRDGNEKPGARAFSYFATQMLPRGRAQRLNATETDIFHYRFGGGRQILWGAGRSFGVTGNLSFRDASGRVIAKPDLIGDAPVIVEGDGEIVLGPRRILADSLYNYGRTPWSYFGQRGEEAAKQLGPVDWRWTTFIGHSTLKPAAINQLGIIPSGKGPRAVKMTVRYTADRGGDIFASGCFDRKSVKGDGVTLDLLHNGISLEKRRLSTGKDEFNTPIRVSTGDTVDFLVDPNGTSQADALLYRLRIALRADAAATC